MGDAILSMDDSKTTSARQRLERVVCDIAAGAGGFHFALLRDQALHRDLIDQGDADLLGDRDSVAALLRMLLSRSVAGDVHFRVTSSKPEKLQLTVFSTDFVHSATYDLWIDLPQIHSGRSLIRYQDIAPQLHRDRGIEPLPACIAGAVYLQHLVTKRKPLEAPHTAARIQSFAAHRCNDRACGVSRWFRDLYQAGTIRQPGPIESARQIKRLLNVQLDDAAHRVKHRWRPRTRMEAGDAVCVLGVDGVGKSTLIESLVHDGVVASEALVGKKLYRRSLFYRLATRSTRHRDPNGREAIDERLAPILFVRAVSAFRRALAWRRLRGRGTLLVDRSPLDFLYLGRKTEQGRFHSATTRLEGLAPLTPTIQLVAPHCVTAARKPEITESGHATYDNSMLMRIAGQCPCDHLVFYNGGDVQGSSQALGQYLDGALKTRGRRHAA